MYKNYINHYRPLILTVYVPALTIITYLWLIPESIRWNLSKGRTEEAKKTLKKLAKVNGKHITDKELEILNVIGKAHYTVCVL